MLYEYYSSLIRFITSVYIKCSVACIFIWYDTLTVFLGVCRKESLVFNDSHDTDISYRIGTCNIGRYERNVRQRATEKGMKCFILPVLTYRHGDEWWGWVSEVGQLSCCCCCCWCWVGWVWHGMALLASLCIFVPCPGALPTRCSSSLCEEFPLPYPCSQERALWGYGRQADASHHYYVQPRRTPWVEFSVRCLTGALPNHSQP